MIKKPSFRLILFFFLLSGAAGLMYQITWFRQLSYFIGNSTYAQSIVLATFMSGLAFGAWFWGKKADQSGKALRIFAWLEIGIAVYCFLYGPIFRALESGFVGIVAGNDLPSDSTLVVLMRLIVSVLAILLPTILMGGTLPVLVRFFTERTQDLGRNVAIFYFINSLGAVVGTVIGGFYLLQTLGVQLTGWVGAGIDLIIGVYCLLASYKVDAPGETPKENQKENASLFPITEKQNRLIFWVAGISGLSAMIYEVVWLRLLIPILSSSTYSFTVILSVFIGGITLGSFIVYKKSASIKNPYKLLTYCQFGIVAATLFTIPFYDALPYYIWSAVGSPNMSSYGFYLSIQLFFVVLLILPPTIFMGMSLPLASRMYVKDVKESGRGIGNIFAFNTLGTVIGSLLAGLILIPFIGIKNTLQIAVAVNLLLAILLYRRGSDFKRSHLILSGVTLVLGILFYLGTVRQQRWAYHIMLSEVSRKINRLEPPVDFDEFMEKAANHDEIHFYEEGINGTIVVAQKDEEVYLFTNGKGDANSVGDLATQVSLGLTPIVLHPSPDSVFVIGFGAGTTIGHVMSHPRVKYGEVAEISGEVIEASSYFNSINAEPLKRKNLRVIKDDGLCALRVSPRKYDVIISQPSNPWSAGVGNLFTREFFHTCKEHLHQGGYVAQWFNLYEMDDESLRLVLRTALSEFKKITLWHLGGSDILLLCSDHDLGMNPEKFRKAFDLSAKEFSKINIRAYPAFLSQELVSDQQTIRKYAGTGPLNTEDLPLLEHWAPRAFYHNASPTKFYKLDERGKLDAHPKHLLGQLLRSTKGLSNEEILQTGLFQSVGGNKDLAHQLADMNPEIYVMWAEKARQMGNMEMAKKYDDRAAELLMDRDPTKSDAERRADQLARSGDVNGALREIQKALQQKESAGLYFQKGNILLSQSKTDECIVAFEKAIQLDPKLLEAYINLAIAKGQKSLFTEVVEILNRAEKISSSNAQVYFNRGYAYALQDKLEASLKDFNRAIEINPNYGQAYMLRGRTHQTMGNAQAACADYQKAVSFHVQGAEQMVQQTCR